MQRVSQEKGEKVVSLSLSILLLLLDCQLDPRKHFQRHATGETARCDSLSLSLFADAAIHLLAIMRTLMTAGDHDDWEARELELCLRVLMTAPLSLSRLPLMHDSRSLTLACPSCCDSHADGKATAHHSLLS